MAEQALASTRLIDGPLHGGPPAFETFCTDYPKLCQAKAGTVRLDDRGLNHLRQTQRVVDGWMMYRRGSREAWKDKWKVLPRGVIASGDCADSVVSKMAELVALGYPASALRPTYAVLPNGSHLVLTVETDQGTYVMDNLQKEPLPISDKAFRNYHFTSRRGANPAEWVRITGSQ